MDVAYLFATVNQLRTAYRLAAPYEGLVIGLLIFSLVLQVGIYLTDRSRDLDTDL